jgi:predicted DNA binding CopG/RHH family protein
MPKKSFSFQKGKPETEGHDVSQDIHRFIAGAREQITRKTIALPEESFVRVKVEAAKRGVPAYQLWGEIVNAYFREHPE